MVNISFEEIGGVVATFYADWDVQRGHVVGLSGQKKVGVMAEGQAVCGVALEVSQDGMACVQVRGFATLEYSGEGVAPGWVALVSDGSGGVRKAGAGEAGQERLVVETDPAAMTAVVLL